MPKELGIIILVPNGEEFPCRSGQVNPIVKEVWEGRGPTNEDVI